MELKRIPVGIEDFKEIIDQGYYYVDKTSLIKDIRDEKVVLYTRPRRFGKTLNMSMLYYFFSVKQQENAYLFDGLHIANDIEIMKSQNQYPIMFISLKDMKDSTFKNQLENFKGIISELVDKNGELLESESLDKFDKEKLERYRCENVNKSELQRSLRFLSQCLYKHYRRKVMILIDEYDVPL